jgi:hypothetical protein
MTRHLLFAAILLGLVACVGSTTNYEVVDQAAIFSSKPALASKEMDAFLVSRGFLSESSSTERRWYKNGNSAFAFLEVDETGCISFSSYVISGSKNRSAAKTASNEFFQHFGQQWAVEQGHVCSRAP